MTIAAEDFLAHHGVKGMKWGQRKEAFSNAQENFNKLSIEVGDRQTRARLHETLDDAEYSRLSTKEVVVPKGASVKRITTNPHQESASDTLYVSTNPQDAKMYKALIPTGTTGGVPAKKQEGFYEVTSEATKEIRSPSEKGRVDAYISLMGQKDIQTQSGEKVTGREYLRRQGLGDLVDGVSDKSLALAYYGQLSATQGIKNDPINTAVFGQLKKKGYNAIVDDNDRGILAKEPLLTLDASNSLKVTSVRPLSTDEIHEAQATATLPPELKHQGVTMTDIQTTEDTDNFLEHYGVLGMRWGKRANASGTKSFKELRKLDKTNRNKDIDTARKDIVNLKSPKAVLAARKQFGEDKYKVGQYEANKAYQKSKDKLMSDIKTSTQVKQGKETAVFILGGRLGSAAIVGKAIYDAKKSND